jgi:hypothetical protein
MNHTEKHILEPTHSFKYEKDGVRYNLLYWGAGIYVLCFMLNGAWMFMPRYMTAIGYYNYNMWMQSDDFC